MFTRNHFQKLAAKRNDTKNPYTQEELNSLTIPGREILKNCARTVKKRSKYDGFRTRRHVLRFEFI